MDLLSIFHQPFQQRRWRVAEVLAKCVTDELGVRPEGRSPAFRRKHNPIVGLLGDQIQQNQPSVQPRTRLEQRAVVRFLVSHVDSFNRLVGGIVEQVELRSSLFLVTSLELIREELVQPQHRSISDHHVPESVDISIKSVGNSDLVEATLSENGVEDTLVIDFPEIKFERHRYFTMRKRVQDAGKDSTHDTLEGREERFVRDRLHKVSRHIVEWSRQFEKPCIVFEGLKEMRDSIDYGTRMNRRLHHLPFRALQYYTSYKAAFEGCANGVD